MDPFGAALNVVSAIELISRCIQSLMEYYDDVMKADANLRRFRVDLDREREALRSLHGLCTRLNSNSSLYYLQVLAAAIQEGPLARSSKSFYTELEALVQWLEKQGKKSTQPRYLDIFKDRKTSLATTSDRQERTADMGMDLSQRLQWPIRGKKKIEKFRPKLAQHREDVNFLLQIIQRSVIAI